MLTFIYIFNKVKISTWQPHDIYLFYDGDEEIMTIMKIMSDAS